MYDELIAVLRHCGSLPCEGCPRKTCEGAMANMREAADAIEKLVEVIQNHDFLESLMKPRWILVTERLPEEDGKYLVRYVRDIDLEDGVHSDEVRIMRFANAQWRFPFICNPDVRKLVTMETVTHWMPLPEPPKEE